MRTFDAQGRVIAQDKSAGVGDLAPITVTATALPPLTTAGAWYSSLLEPPTVYYVAAGLAFVAWMISNKRGR